MYSTFIGKDSEFMRRLQDLRSGRAVKINRKRTVQCRENRNVILLVSLVILGA